jgi:alpha-D-xyloside xylohydrolase
MNWRGREATLIHGNVIVAVPFLLSTAGWGMLWDNPSHTEFRDGPDRVVPYDGSTVTVR